MPQRPTLLYLAHRSPLPLSTTSRIRTYNWLHHLAQYFDITLVIPAWEPISTDHREALSGMCRRLLTPCPDVRQNLGQRLLQTALAELHMFGSGRPAESFHLQTGVIARSVYRELRAERFDAAFAERWTWGRLLLTAAPFTIVDSGSVYATRFAAALGASPNPVRRMLASHLRRRAARAETRLLRSAGLVLAHDAAARRALLSLQTDTHVELIPNALDTQHFQPQPSVPVDARHIVFAGSLRRMAQRDALAHFCRDILPQVRKRVGDVRVSVFSAPGAAEMESLSTGAAGVRFVAEEDDPRPLLLGAATAVAPLRVGAGSFSGMSQLLALGVPVIATPEAVQRIDAVSGDGILVAEKGADFTDAVVQVLRDASLRSDLARRAREHAIGRWSMQATYERFSEALHHAVLERRAAQQRQASTTPPAAV